MAKFGDKPGSVLVDMGQIDVAPDKRFPFLVISGPKTQSCDQQGLPDKGEIDELESILDATSNFLTGLTPKVLTGTLTYKCERLNYYYVKDTMNVRNAITRMYVRNFPSYGYAINILSDPDWHTYRTFLYPDEQTRDWMENDKVIAKMIAGGDSLITRRDVNFEIYFATDTDRKAFITFAKEKGYRISNVTTAGVTSAPFALTITKADYVKTDVIGSLESDIKRELRKHRGLYDGWNALLKK